MVEITQQICNLTIHLRVSTQMFSIEIMDFSEVIIAE